VPHQKAKAAKKTGKKPKELNYYTVLDVPHDADQAAIKKAYREKSLEYHPDKCALEKDTCQAKFIQVSSAYEVLSDKDKRRTYDEHGEEGLKDGGASGGNAEAMFRQFFGREPNGKVKIVHGPGGQMMFMEQGEEGPEENLYDNTEIVELQSEAWNSIIKQRDEPWLIQFYKPNVDECVEIAEEYKQLGKTFSDFVSIASVNCRKQRDICQDVKSFPTVKWFTEEQSEEPEVYEGTINAKLLGKYVNSLLKDYSTILSEKRRMREWIDTQQLPVVTLFSDKKEVPPMWRALSREFRNRVSLGTVLRCDKNGVFKTELQREFDVRIPGIAHVDSVGEIGTIAEKFDSQFKKKVVALWLQKIIAVAKKAGPAASFKEWTKQRVEAGDCGPTDGQFCFLWLKAGADKKVEDAMRSLAVKYRTDPIKMMWVSVELNPSVLDAFGLENSDGTDFFIAYRSKRGRFRSHEGELTFEQLDTFVDGVLNGGPLTSKVHVEKFEL
jgi:DnaJ family protein C protein 16